MEENKNAEVAGSEATENEELNSTENTEKTAEETKEETIEEIKARAEKAEELANNYKIRAEKAEKKAKESVTTETKASGDLSSKDILAIAKADIHEDDMDRVISFARSERISVKDALASDDLKAILSMRKEKRKTAAASNTGTARRGAVKLSDEEIIGRVEKGELPEDPEALARARMNLRKNKK